MDLAQELIERAKKPGITTPDLAQELIEKSRRAKYKVKYPEAGEFLKPEMKPAYVSTTRIKGMPEQKVEPVAPKGPELAEPAMRLVAGAITFLPNFFKKAYTIPTLAGDVDLALRTGKKVVWVEDKTKPLPLGGYAKEPTEVPITEEEIKGLKQKLKQEKIGMATDVAIIVGGRVAMKLLRPILQKVRVVLFSRKVGDKDLWKIMEKMVGEKANVNMLTDFERMVWLQADQIAKNSGLSGIKDLYVKMLHTGAKLKWIPKGKIGEGYWTIAGYEAPKPIWPAWYTKPVKPEAIVGRELNATELINAEAKQTVKRGLISTGPKSDGMVIALEKQIIPEVVSKKDIALFIKEFGGKDGYLRQLIYSGGSIHDITQKLKGAFYKEYGKPIALPGEVEPEVKPTEKPEAKLELKGEVATPPKTIKYEKLGGVSFLKHVKEKYPPDDIYLQTISNKFGKPVNWESEEYALFRKYKLFTNNPHARTPDEVGTDMGIDEETLRTKINDIIYDYQASGKIEVVQGRHKINRLENEILTEYSKAINLMETAKGTNIEKAIKAFEKAQAKAKDIVKKYPLIIEEMGLSTKQALAESKREAATDFLTGTLNHRQLAKDFSVYSAAEKNFIIFDGVGFGRFNEKPYNKAIGDKVLEIHGKVFADYMVANPSARIYRQGGDQFIMITDDIVGDGELHALNRKLGEEAAKTISELKEGDYPMLRWQQGKIVSGEDVEGSLSRISQNMEENWEKGNTVVMPPEAEGDPWQRGGEDFVPVEKAKPKTVKITGYHTKISKTEAEKEFGFIQRGEGTYIALDKPFQPEKGKVVNVEVDIEPSKIFDPNGLMEGTNIEKSKADFDKMSPIMNKEMAKPSFKKDFTTRKIPQLRTKVLQDMGYEAEAGWIDGPEGEVRELIVFDRAKVKETLELKGKEVRAPVAKKTQTMIPGAEAREFPKEAIKPETPEEKARAAMAEAKPKPLFETAGEKGAEQLRLGSQGGEGFFVGAGLSPEQMQLFIGAGLEPIATTAQGRITQYQNNKIRFDIPKVEKGKGFKEFLRTIYTHGFDRFHPISRLVHKDMNLPPLEDPKLLAYLSTGWQGKVIAALEGFTWRYTPAGKVEVTGPSLAQIIQPYSKNYKDIMTLQVAQRELWLAEQGRGTKGITPDFSIRTIGAIKETYVEEGFKKFEMVAQQKREWANRAILEPLRDVGRISEKQYQRWIKDPHVPFARVIEEIESELGAEGRSGDLGFLKELKGSERIIKNPDQELIERHDTTTQYVDKQRVVNSIVNLPQIATDLNGEIYEVGKGDLSPFKFKSWEDGKAKYFKVPKDVYKAVNDITPHDMGLLWKIIGIPKRMLQVGATLNPAFMGKNIWRDSGSAFAYSDNNFIPFVDHLPAVAHLIGRTDLYYRWLASGGAHAALVSMEDIKMGYKYWQLLGKKDVGAYVKNPLKFPEQIGEAIENSTRLGDFRKAIRSGRPDLIAAYASKEVSVNFARYGASMGIPRKTVAFYTANIAGGDRLVRAFSDHPGRTTWKALLFCTIPAITEWVLFHDDDRWRNLPPWRKYLFTNIPIGKHIFTMPVPFELGLIFGGLTKAFLTWAFDKEPQVMGEWAEQMVESMAPGYYGFPLPTAIMPVLEDRAKWSYFFNKPLPPKSVQGLPQEMQYTPYTSETAKAIGGLVGKSPTVLENYLFSYTGGLGKDVLFVVENILSKKGFISTPEAELPKGLADFPWTRGFFGREPIGTGSYPMQRFYEEYDKAKEQMNKIRVLTQRGKLSIEDLNKSEELAKYEVLDNMLKEINTLRRTRDALLWSKIDPVLKKEQLDKIDATITLLAAWTIKGLKKRKFKKP